MRKSPRTACALGLWLALGGLPGLAGCVGKRADAELRGVVLIVLDTLRADGLGAYGNPRPTSPTLDALAERGVLFEQAVSNASWTLPSFVGLLSGRYPSGRVMDEKLQSSLVERLAEAGWRTAAFTEGGYVSSYYGLDRGFAEFVEEQDAVRHMVGGRPIHARAEGGIEVTFRRAEEWLREHAGERFFLMVHTYEVHTPYRRREYAASLPRGRLGETFEIGDSGRALSEQPQVAEAELAYIRALYDGGVAAADRHVGALLAALEELGLAERTLVVVTSDHGEDLGDREPPRPGVHAHTLYDELVLVPLILYDPRVEPPARRVRAQVRTVDVLPTILDLVGLPPVPGVEGRSLAGLVRGEEAGGRPAYAELGKGALGIRRAAIRDGGHKLILNVFPQRAGVPSVELYDLEADPRESRNLADAQPELRERLEGRMREVRAGIDAAGAANYASPAEMPEGVRERLKALGYVE